jgi:hypothetical protein
MSTHGTVHQLVAAGGRARPRRPRPRRLTWSARLGRGRPAVEDSWVEASRLIDALGGDGEEDLSAEQCRILKIRWIEQAKMYEQIWRQQRAVYYIVRVPIILGATTIPVLASLGVNKLVTALVGLAVALLTALDSFLQLGSRWHRHCHTATELVFEGWMFLERAGGYAGKSMHQAYRLFITRLEGMNRRAAFTYLSAFRASDVGDPRGREATATDK